jgi:hypothetical protein
VSYGDAGTQPTGAYWLVLGHAVVFLVATWALCCSTQIEARITTRPAPDRTGCAGSGSRARSVSAATVVQCTTCQ